MVNENFCIFIISYKRAKNLNTIDALLRCNYSGKYYIVIGNDDDTAQEYYDTFGSEIVYVFDKDKYMKTCDTRDNLTKKNCAIFVRNALFDIAKEKGVDYFLVLDDDFTDFMYRFPALNDKNKTILRRLRIKDLDSIINAYVKFIKNTDVTSVCFAQMGDFVGGGIGTHLCRCGVKRKAMGSFFYKTDRPMIFEGRMNDDVSSYCKYGNRGEIFFTLPKVAVDTKATQSVKGGLTELYKQTGTYQKSFYTILNNPSFVSVSIVGVANYRLHHKVYVKWGWPQILHSSVRKKKREVDRYAF